MSVATATCMAIAVTVVGAGAAFPLFVGSAGMILNAQKVRPQMPDYVEHAMNMIMADSLRRCGWLTRELSMS